jgi:hypothetical protein
MTTDIHTNTGCRTIVSWVAAIASAAAILVSASTLASAEVKTLEPGKLTIGMNGDMPMTQLKDGQLGGTDGELMVYVAKQIGLEPNVQQADWSALIEATKQGKIDVMHGVGWLEAPQDHVLSEPICTRRCSPRGERFDLRRHEGRKVGTVTGLRWCRNQSVDGIGGRSDLHAASCRICWPAASAAILDPPLVDMRSSSIEWKLSAGADAETDGIH